MSTVPSHNEPVQSDMNAAPAETASTVDASTATPSPVKADESERQVPVSEARKYRRRAQQAEKALDDARRAIDTAQQTLRDRDELIADLNRQRLIDETLCDAGTLDLPTVRVLVQQALTNTADDLTQAAIITAVDAVRRKVSHLFRSSGARRTGAMGPRASSHASEPTPASIRTEDAATAAVQSGTRTDLLTYLRLRRKKRQ